ncbi:MAG: GNAT family N-acetyltransferase [Pseudonocardiales bacterium]|nr:MAG: GNAT family N-acetyltransferase [Pseudonocardiales bacterium]
MFTVRSALATDRLVLRPFRPEDVDDVLAMRSRPEVVRYLYGDVLTRREVVDSLAKRMALTSLRQDGDALALAVERREDRRVIGDITLRLHSAKHRQGEIGFVFHPAEQGKGYAREAATAVLDIAFGPVALHRVIGRTDARNVASAALLRRLGMTQEAHLRHSEIFKGDWGDELIFGLLEHEWRAAGPASPLR